ncbi:MAG: hypothetical protein AABW51_03825 [Nanoarchaeota archaeon]
MEAHSENQIRSRVVVITAETRGNPSKTIARIAREYGVNPWLYYPRMSQDQIVSTTQKNQPLQSQLELEMLNESRQYSL